MNRDHFWLTHDRFSKIEPYLPTDTRGKARVDDRRVISGIINVLRSGGRWIDAPPEYGPRKTLYNRYVRWAARGVWVDLFHALQAGGPPDQVLIDNSAVKAHRSASGGKGGKTTRRSVARAGTDDQNSCLDGRRMPSALVHTHRRPRRRLQSGCGTFGATSALSSLARGQGLLQLERNPQASRGTRRDPQHSAQSQSQVEDPLLAVPLSSAQRHRAHVLPLERLQAGGNAL